jgi:predicted MFS family arabinose efflux permease
VNSLIIEVLKELLTAWRDGTRRMRATIGMSIMFVVFAIIMLLAGKFVPYMRNITEGIAGVLGGIGGVLALTISHSSVRGRTTATIHNSLKMALYKGLNSLFCW